MERTEIPQTPRLGEEGEACLQCSTTLATDQRYCLNCGERRAEARLPFMEILRGDGDGDRLREVEREVELAPVPPPSRLLTAPMGVAAMALLVLALGVGVLIGDDSEPQARPVALTQPAPVINVQAGGTPVAEETFKSDWPEGEDGFTVQLQTLPKDGTDVAAVTAAKTAAEGQGAEDVGALDSDEYASLDGGEYVVYSGVFSKRAQAKKALKKLKKDFRDAKVVEVSGGVGDDDAGDPDALSGKKKKATVSRKQLEDLNKLSPAERQKRSLKLPDETKLPGKPPKKDKKKPGGGSDAETIG